MHVRALRQTRLLGTLGHQGTLSNLSYVCTVVYVKFSVHSVPTEVRCAFTAS